MVDPVNILYSNIQKPGIAGGDIEGIQKVFNERT